MRDAAGGAVLGTVAYRVTIALLTAAGAARPVPGRSRLWPDAAMAAVVVAGTVLAFRQRRPAGHPAPGPSRLPGVALVAGGAAWLAWGLADQHLLGVVEVAAGSPHRGWWDALFHGAGAAAAAIGAGRLPPAARAVPHGADCRMPKN